MKITRKTNFSVVEEKNICFITPEKPDEIIYCPHCTAEMIPAQVSADFFGFSSRIIYRLIEADKIHFLETEKKQIFICPLSVSEVLPKFL